MQGWIQCRKDKCLRHLMVCPLQSEEVRNAARRQTVNTTVTSVSSIANAQGDTLSSTLWSQVPQNLYNTTSSLGIGSSFTHGYSVRMCLLVLLMYVITQTYYIVTGCCTS